MSEADSPPAQSPFAIPIFRAVWFASLASNFGGLIQSVGAAWMMTSLSASPQLVALVPASTTLPIMLLSLWAGAVADNIDRRLVMLACQLFMLVVSALLALFAWEGLLTPWSLLAFTFLVGCATAINLPAWQASVGDMVSRSQLPSAVALNSMGFNLARSVGPALGGVIVAAAGAAAAFLTNALSYIGLSIVLLRWRPERAPQLLPRERLGVAMRAGLRYVSMSPKIQLVLLRGAAFGIGASAVSALMPLVARDILGGDALTFGLLSGAFGIGAVLGALSSGRLRQRYSIETIVRSAALALALGTAIAASTGWLAVALAGLMLCGAGWVIALSTFNVSVQMSAPRWVLARAVALYQMMTFGGMALGAWLFGWLAEHYGVATSLHIAAGTQIAAAAIGLLRPLSETGDENLDLLNRWQEPQTAVPIEPRSGPVVVTIEYRIPSGSVVPFLAAMSERRRIRRRDGAHGWSLLRDLADPELWIERYHVSTWLDYVRHNSRRTIADLANWDALAALHHGSDPPVVHRMLERQTGSLPIGRMPDVREMGDPMTDPTRSS
ncbi:ABC transporter permease [Sphingobium herbicidovorans NBRC 16415]|uniref:ABC transporter permease n=1 Tax=Sphingobium herbicidovorans (strain ATCC 700291 / DSM 11019 / CCUG 56400 / KCTC 2939 / LMG 18315 / NBRC 16415 / MH) TaxID=1219045 RepID=A0A086P8M5_SPHHM|nr:MFS transporter [Sphingobium herbicidovorans]KFG89743.1 ABC transporter permease [Sphingobium herbicidovorans NBRC 16415]